jgi:hypothetical protein
LAVAREMAGQMVRKPLVLSFGAPTPFLHPYSYTTRHQIGFGPRGYYSQH